MREILFRAKRLDNSDWAESKSICRNEYEDGSSEWFIGAAQPAVQLRNEQGNMTAVVTIGECLFYACDPETVGQFTGLTDKNGKKIFEGDILQSWSDYYKNYYYQGVVRYGEFNCSCCDGVYGWYLDGGDIRNIDSYEVCGNIHDNPELLEVTDNA